MTFFSFVANLVATGVYIIGVDIIRLPCLHTENDCDESMQAMSVLALGNSNNNALATSGESN